MARGGHLSKVFLGEVRLLPFGVLHYVVMCCGDLSGVSDLPTFLSVMFTLFPQSIKKNSYFSVLVFACFLHN